MPQGNRRRGAQSSVGEGSMWDVIMIAMGIGFFALSIAYTYACDRL